MSAYDLRNSGWISTVGTTLLFFDVLGIILLYEFVSRFVTGLFARFFISTATIAAIDSVLFMYLIQYSSPQFGELLRAGLIGKTVASLFNAAVYTTYLRSVETQRAAVGTGDVADVFQALTYRQKYEQARQRMTRDALTGLFNRGYFDEALPTAIEHARRYTEPVSLLLIDTDRFKEINDQFFHIEGDRALRLIGRTLSELSRAADVPCRFGGDEFVVILSHTPHAEAILFAERIRAGLRDRCLSADPPFPWAEVTTTIGIATYPSDGNVRTPEDLLRIADERLYAGKEAGRNRVSAAGPGSSSSAHLTNAGR
jgi:diguanylate cyclase (GGDEF)-like protein